MARDRAQDRHERPIRWRVLPAGAERSPARYEHTPVVGLDPWGTGLPPCRDPVLVRHVQQDHASPSRRVTKGSLVGLTSDQPSCRQPQGVWPVAYTFSMNPLRIVADDLVHQVEWGNRRRSRWHPSTSRGVSEFFTLSESERHECLRQVVDATHR